MLLIIGLVIGAAAVVFALQNITPVVITFLGWDFQGSVALVVILAVAAGVIITLLFSLPSAIDGVMERGRLRRQARKLENDLEDHKEMLDHAHKQVMEQPKVIVVEKEIESASDDSRLI